MKLRQFISEIGIPEFKAVIGKKGLRMLFLFFILFISILVIGVSNSADALLEEKMDEPTINFIDVKKPWLTKNKKKEIKVKDAKTLAKEIEFLKDDFSRVHLAYKDFVMYDDAGKKKEKQILGMLLTENDVFYEYMENLEGWIKSDTNKFKDKGFGIILTLDFFKEFGLKGNDWMKKSFVEIILKNNTKVNIPISAVVSTLRNESLFAISKNLLQTEFHDIEFLKSEHYPGQSTFFLPAGSEFPPSFSKVSSPNLSDDCYKKGFLVKAINPNKNDLLRIKNLEGCQEVFDISIPLSDDPDGFDSDFFTFFLKDLDKVDSLASIVDSKFGIQIQQSKIEAKNNFSFFRKITDLLSTSLSLFAALSIIFFIVNILMSHLNANKRSLGTLKAFGLSNFYILGIYSGITVFLVSFSFFIAYLLAFAIGPFAINLFVYLSGIKGDFSEEFTFENVEFLKYFLLLVILPTLVILLKIFKFLYKVTPGDLIYERK